MAKLSDLDSNFRVETNLGREGIRFLNVRTSPFSVHGVIYEGERFRRMPEAVAKAVSPGVLGLHTCTAGGRVRFRTDSPYVAISAKMSGIGRASHFSLTGTAGFDLYVKADGGQRYVRTFSPPADMTAGYEAIHDFGKREMRELTVNMPQYSGVTELFIGLDADAALEAPTPYKNADPVVFYGSSITQGGCASRPGRSYSAVLSAKYGFDYVNLGFSGNAKAEDAMIEYLAGLPMSFFVYDYDYNAPSTPHYDATHEKLFRAVRASHPGIPILMMSRPCDRLYPEAADRVAIMRRTYENAVAAGDSNVYMLTGPELFALCGNEGTVDGCHPSDFGFASMAAAVGELIERYELLE